MGDVFVRKTTFLLLLVIFLLSIVCVALIVLLVGPQKKQSSEPSAPLPERNVIVVTQPTHTEHKHISKHLDAKSDMPASPSPDSKAEPWEANLRIPRTTIPYHYDLLLHPDLQTEYFHGHVSTIIGVTSTMNYLVTHVKLMNVTSTELFDSTGAKLKLKDAFEHAPNEFWVVLPEETLEPGNYTLSMSFTGPLKGHIVGFYMSEYLTKTGERRSIATSKFQPTDARRAFPCFDEPSFKSTFKTTLVRPSEGYIALSNMPVQTEKKDTPIKGLTSVEFKTSVPMVTYLACFIVCDFEYLEATTNKSKPFRVYSTPDQIHRATYARDIGVEILNYFERYFEVDYPLPKQDMIAIPDFVSGAMEHWGLITYRESNLLYDDTNSSSYNKQRVAIVVSHELAHMWFGNLVTLEWWDDLWLNEGFASYVEYKGVANYEKDWDMMDQFLITDLYTVFELDQILSSHPIVQPVNHPDEITEIFDRISYSKGASVLRMLENFMGAENFRKGVRNFLQRFKYGNAITQDLWDELQKTVQEDLNITSIMDTWTRQMGFPVLMVKNSPIDKNKIEVRQQRFLIDPEAKSKADSPFNYKWDIPVTYMTKNIKNGHIWFFKDQDKVILNRPADAGWMKLNVDQYGYYRANYAEGMWEELISVLQNDQKLLGPSDRANLIDDSFALAAAGLQSYDVAFQIVSYLPRETHFVPWSTAQTHLMNLGDLLQNTKAYSAFRKYVLKLVDKHVDRVGWEDTGSHTERRNRAVLLKLACHNGHSKCIDDAVTKFQSWVRDPTFVIPANLRDIVYIYGIEGTGELEWETLFERYLIELNAQEKAKMLRGLTATKEPWIANRLLDAGKNETLIRKQDFFSMLSYMAYNPSGLPSVWSFIRANWDWMVKEFSLNNRYLGTTVRKVAYRFTSPLQLKELESFFHEYPDAGSGKRARSQALEKVNQNIKWIESYADQLYIWLRKNAV